MPGDDDHIIGSLADIKFPRDFEQLKELANGWLLTVFADYADHLSDFEGH